MKKLFTLIVAICATTLAWADDSGNCGSNVTYTYVESTGTLTISGTGDMYSYSYASNWPWYNYRSSIKKVVINNGVTSIGKNAFNGCTGLTSITIPNSVTSIGYGAFYGCTGLTSITIPNSVTSIGDIAFDGCTGLTSINVAEDNLNYASIDGFLYSKDKKTLIMCPMGKTGSITIPNSVTSIGIDAFYGCEGLTSVTIPNSVTSIGEWAFDGCTGLTSMTVEATNPPLCVNELGDGLSMPNYNIPLYVPAASVDAYKAEDEWEKFTNIQAIPATGVNEAAAEKSEVKKIIDRNGIIYIEKDGTRYFLNGGKAE
ncbi:MAG: leucine-rich repeat domain-containing protein [Paludibacteraceae bacterium]|nr:leucine-rich repeat domain-containing protein [Paludibacteraceae bacterium]